MSLLGVPFTRSPSCRFISCLFSVTTFSVIDITGEDQINHLPLCSLEWHVWLLGQSDSTHMIRVPSQRREWSARDDESRSSGEGRTGERGVSSLRTEELTFLHLHVAKGSLWHTRISLLLLVRNAATCFVLSSLLACVLTALDGMSLLISSVEALSVSLLPFVEVE